MSAAEEYARTFVPWALRTFPNADTVPAVRIPWGDDEDSGLMIDHEEGQFRIGVYADLTYEWDAVLYATGADQAISAVEYLTEEQPEGTDWAAWAAQRVTDWEEWEQPSRIDYAVGALLAQLEDLPKEVALAAAREVVAQLEREVS